MAPPALDIAPSLKSQAVRRALWLSGGGQELNTAPVQPSVSDLPAAEPRQKHRHGQSKESTRASG